MRLLSLHGNTVLVCDVSALTAAKMPKADKLDAKALPGLWDDLQGTDGEKAYRAMQRLAASSAKTTPFLKKQLATLDGPDPDDQRIAQLVAELDDNSFDVRESASAALAKRRKRRYDGSARQVSKGFCNRSLPSE